MQITLRNLLTIHDHMPPIPPGEAILYGCHDVDRSMFENDEYFSPLLEGIKFLTKDTNYSTVNFSHPYSLHPSSKIKGGSIVKNRKMAFLRFKMALTKFIMPQKRRVLLRGQLEKKYYHDILAITSPTIVFSIQPPEMFCKAAKSLNICVIEIMHGNNISEKDKIFSQHMSKPAVYLPDKIISFDSCTHETVSKLSHNKNIECYQTINPWYHYQQYHYQHSKDLADHTAKIKQRNVLITLQWGYDGERDALSNIIPNGIIHPTLEAALVDPQNNHINFSIRLHPIQRLQPTYRHHRLYIEELCKKKSNLELENASTSPLPILLKEMDCHITMCSSVVGEASEEKVPSLLLCPSLQEGGNFYGYFRELEPTNLVSFGTLNTSEINNWIKHQPTRAARKNSYNAAEMHASLVDFYKYIIDNNLKQIQKN